MNHTQLLARILEDSTEDEDSTDDESFFEESSYDETNSYNETRVRNESYSYNESCSNEIRGKGCRQKLHQILGDTNEIRGKGCRNKVHRVLGNPYKNGIHKHDHFIFTAHNITVDDSVDINDIILIFDKE
jgi:hypothetical protein